MDDIKPPKKNWNDVVRTMLEKFIEAKVPFYGSLVTYAGRIFVPSALERQTKSWQENISNRVISLENSVEQLSGATLLSELAIRIGCFVSNESQDGIVEPFEVKEIISQFTDFSEAEIYEACGELEHAGVCELEQLINSKGYLNINIDFFFVFDPYVHSWHPALDVAKLARKIVVVTAKDQAAVSAEIAEEFGWGARRYNPSLQMIVAYISEGRVGQGYTPPWAHRYLYATPGERAALKELARNMDGM
jgi:hypothetical protein